MNGPELLRIVDAIHREKNIPKDVIFEGISSALVLATKKHFNDEAEDVVVDIDRISGKIEVSKGGVTLDPTILGRIAAQSAKQVMIQKNREAECNSVFDEYAPRKGEMVIGTVQRLEGGSALVTIGTKTEAFLPRSEMIPGETPHVGQRLKAVILEVRKLGSRVRIVLSRTHPDFVRRLFEQEIPEVNDRTISIRAIAREAGYRTKIAASSIDSKVDAVGACVGVRGSRIKNIVDELGGERIDIVRWNESLQVMIPNALQPATISEVFLYPRLGRAIVMVAEDQLSLAIGRRGQNVRLASKLVGWDIEIMTEEELSETIERAEGYFRLIPNVTEHLVERFIEEGFLSYDDLTFQEPAVLAELVGISEEEAANIIAFAEAAAEAVEDEERRRRSEPESSAGDEATADAAVPEDAPASATEEQTVSEQPPSPDAVAAESPADADNAAPAHDSAEAAPTESPIAVEPAESPELADAPAVTTEPSPVAN